MAKHVIETLIDDLTGDEAVETIAFSAEGVNWEIDLSEENAAKLRDALAPFIAAARRAQTATPTRRTASAPSASGRSRDETRAIRVWAAENGYSISERGRIPENILSAYESGTPAPAKLDEPTAETPAEDVVAVDQGQSEHEAEEAPKPKRSRARAKKEDGEATNVVQFADASAS